MPRGKVYVIDDDEAMRHSLEFLLNSADFEVVLFVSAQAFLDRLTGLDFGCVVSDVRMTLVEVRRAVWATGPAFAQRPWEVVMQRFIRKENIAVS